MNNAMEALRGIMGMTAKDLRYGLVNRVDENGQPTGDSDYVYGPLVNGGHVPEKGKEVVYRMDETPKGFQAIALAIVEKLTQ